MQNNNSAALMYTTQHMRENPLSRGKLHEPPSYSTAQHMPHEELSKSSMQTITRRPSAGLNPSPRRSSVSPSMRRSSVSPSARRSSVSPSMRRSSVENDNFYNMYDQPEEKSSYLNPLHD